MNGPSKLSQLSDKPQSAPANYNSGGYKAPQSSSYSTETSYPASTGYNQSQFGTTSVGGQFAQQNYSQMPSSLQTPTVSIHFSCIFMLLTCEGFLSFPFPYDVLPIPRSHQSSVFPFIIVFNHCLSIPRAHHTVVLRHRA